MVLQGPGVTPPGPALRPESLPAAGTSPECPHPPHSWAQAGARKAAFTEGKEGAWGSSLCEVGGSRGSACGAAGPAWPLGKTPRWLWN